MSDARTGQILKSIQTGSAMMAAPMTYMIGGVQYVAIMAGYGGTTIGMTYPDSTAPAHYLNEGRIIVFKLGGGAVPTPPARHTPAVSRADRADRQRRHDPAWVATVRQQLQPLPPVRRRPGARSAAHG